MFDVICVGILVADCMVKPVARIPEKGKLDLVERISLFTGGCATNVAIDLSKIGLNTAVAGKVGDDGFGHFLVSELQAQHVCTDALVVDGSATTSASVVMVTPDGERSFLHCLGANGMFYEHDIDYSVVRQSGIVFVGGTMLLPGFDGEGCAQFLKKSKEMGKTTVLDTAWDSQGRWMKVLGPSMPYIDYFLPSFEEAAELSGKRDPEDIADVFLDMGPRIVVIKLGKDGCFIKTGSGEKYRIPTCSRIKPVDTNGAGDSFCAGFLTGIVRKWDLEKCGEFANAVGTLCVTAAGASTGIQSEGDVFRFMEDYKAGRI